MYKVWKGNTRIEVSPEQYQEWMDMLNTGVSCCQETDPVNGVMCTRKAGHDGIHVAHGRPPYSDAEWYVAAVFDKAAVKLYDVPFLVGDGSGEVMLKVRYVADFPRDEDGLCPYCHNDPCAEHSGPDTLIGAYFKRNPKAETCPCCGGRAP